ncbi:tetratricopeptide repeat protein [Pedobacter sandarakinus]|uniref:tetratricopeptide repeat protein n=1 Tax=Pedobacter sandarakinus TaxID=353156 RepID=UPI00224706CF|nr:tetratricopeptide repeat protein [Pedobacter sandarakinus]MCX2576335.1 tetratricopeptide repeat protein [Pedobacter sandarakinus]
MKKYFFFFLALINLNAFGQMPGPANVARDSNMVKQMFFAGLREKMAENYEAAAKSFSKIIDLDPKQDAAYYELASANFRLNRLPEAALNMVQALKIKPDNVWYNRMLAEIYKRGNKMTELIAVFDALIKIEPDVDGYYFDKANAQYLANQPEAAKKTYDEILTRFGDSNELQNAKRRLAGSGSATQSDIVKLLEGNQADVKNYLYAAGLLLQKGNDAEALNVLAKAHLMEPNNYEVNLGMADIYKKQKNDKATFSALQLAFESPEMPLNEKIKILASLFNKLNQPTVAGEIMALSKLLADKNPTEAKALALYGDVLYQQNKFKEALVQYRSALKLNDQIYAVWEQIINIETLIGQYNEAVKVGDEALTIYPNQASLYYYTAYALFKTGKMEQAQNNLKNALQLDVDNRSLQAQVYALQGDIYINQNNFNQAKVAFEKAIAIEPDNYLIMNNYAYYLALKNDDLAKAAKYAETAANAMPENPSTCDTYSYILFKQQKYDLAKVWIEKALQNNSDKNGVYLEHYGDILYFTGDKGAALEQWIKAKAAGNSADILNRKINEKKYFK